MRKVVKIWMGALLLVGALDVHAGNHRVQLLSRGADSLAARIAAIQNARSTIDILAYEIKPCNASTVAILHALMLKAKQGVRVRMVVDQFSLEDKYEQLLATYFNAYGMQLRLFNGPLASPVPVNRNHAKLFVIDGASANFGSYVADGRNLTDAYFGMAKGLNYTGRDLMVSGPSAREAQAGFDTIFESAYVHAAVRPGSPASIAGSCLYGAESQFERGLRLGAQAHVQALPSYSCPDVTYHLDDPRFTFGNPGGVKDDDKSNLPADRIYMTPDRLKYKKSSAAMLAFIQETRESITLENQYYIPMAQLHRLIRGLLERQGPKVLVLTNLEALSSVPAVEVAMNSRMQQLIRVDAADPNMAILPLSRSGVAAFEGPLNPGSYKGGWYIHSKSAVRDHRDVMVGSFNLDNRSFAANVESATIVRNCPTLATAIEAEYGLMVNAHMQDMRDCPECHTLKRAGFLEKLLGIFASPFF